MRRTPIGTRARTILLGSVVAMSALHLAGARLGAQQAATAPETFEVASIRRNPNQITEVEEALRQIQRLPGGRFRASTQLRNLIFSAWELKAYQRVEGPAKVLDERFDIVAKAANDIPVPAPGETSPFNRMLKALLIDRFKVQVRFDEEMQPAMVLRRASSDKLGPGLRPSSMQCPTGAVPAPGPERVLWQRCHSGMMSGSYDGVVPSIGAFATFVSTLSRQLVVDDTGLEGAYEIKTGFDPTVWMQALFPRPLPPNNLQSFKDAMRNDLGLRVDVERRPVKILVVEHVEEPEEH